MCLLGSLQVRHVLNVLALSAGSSLCSPCSPVSSGFFSCSPCSSFICWVLSKVFNLLLVLHVSTGYSPCVPVVSWVLYMFSRFCRVCWVLVRFSMFSSFFMSLLGYLQVLNFVAVSAGFSMSSLCLLGSLQVLHVLNVLALFPVFFQCSPVSAVFSLCFQYFSGFSDVDSENLLCNA